MQQPAHGGRVYRTHFGGPPQRHSHGGGSGAGGASGNVLGLLQLLPLVALFLFTFFTASSPAPQFRLAPQPPYSSELHTRCTLRSLSLSSVSHSILHACSSCPLVRHPNAAMAGRCSNLGVPFYVKPDFERENPPDSRTRRRIEAQAESEYRDHVETRCYYERVQQSQLYRWGQVQKARTMPMPMCDELRRLQRAF
eukprot:SM000244S08545  [mRNA]  locus=s244:94:1368:+ [translate_table: standard]